MQVTESVRDYAVRETYIYNWQAALWIAAESNCTCGSAAYRKPPTCTNAIVSLSMCAGRGQLVHRTPLR